MLVGAARDMRTVCCVLYADGVLLQLEEAGYSVTDFLLLPEVIHLNPLT